MLNRRTFVGATLAGMALSLTGPQKAFAQRPITYDLLDHSAPQATTTLFNGGPVSIADYKGRYLIAEFWGVWCPDCIVDAPHVNALYDHFKNNNQVGFLAFHTGDRYGKWQNLQNYVTDKNIEYPIAMDLDGQISKQFAIGWFPTFVLIGPDGQIVDWRTDLGAEGLKDFIAKVEARLD